MKRIDGFLGPLFGSMLPLATGLVGLAIVVIDLVGLVNFPKGYADEILLAAASVVLLSYYVTNSRASDSLNASKDLNQRVNITLGQVQATLGDVREIPSVGIRQNLKDNLVNASTFYFRGGSGRWLKSYTFPELAKITDREVEMQIQLVDPRDEHLCREYSSYRHRARTESNRRDDEENPRLIQRDILASIYLAGYYSSRARLKTKITLLKTFSPLRYDVSDRGLIISVPDETKPGIFAASGSWFHGAVVDEMRQTEHGNVTLTLTQDSQHYPSGLVNTTSSQVKAALEKAVANDVRFNPSPLLTDFAALAEIDWEELVSRHVR